MNDEVAFNKLLVVRPVIIGVMLRDFYSFRSAESLASHVIAQSDSPELVELIKKSASYIFESQLTQRATDLPYSDDVLCKHELIALYCPQCFAETASR